MDHDDGVSAKQLLEREKSSGYCSIPTFVQTLDEILGGGIKPGLVTEIVGDSGLGKTTFCLQLCLDVQVPNIIQGLGGEAVFIDTENSFVVNRLAEMTRAFVLHCNSVIPKGCNSRKLSERGVMNGIHVIKCKNLSMLVKIILALEVYIENNRKIRLVVLDGIAFPFYAEGESFHDRTKPLYSIGQVLHYLAGKYGIAVVLTNNLTTRFGPNRKEYFIPYLGESWFHIPNQRINLYWDSAGRSRVAEIVKSPYVPSASVNYKVTGSGIRD